MADIVYRMAEKSVDEASAWYEYQPEVPEKLKKRNSCKLVWGRRKKQMDEMMLEVQVWLNKTYNVGVVEDRNTGQ